MNLVGWVCLSLPPIIRNYLPLLGPWILIHSNSPQLDKLFIPPPSLQKYKWHPGYSRVKCYGGTPCACGFICGPWNTCHPIDVCGHHRWFLVVTLVISNTSGVWHHRCLHNRIASILCIMCLICLKKDLIVNIEGYLCNYDFMQGPFYSLIWIGCTNIAFVEGYLQNLV